MRTGRKHEKKKRQIKHLRDEKYNFSDEKYAEWINRLDNVENISAF